MKSQSVSFARRRKPLKTLGSSHTVEFILQGHRRRLVGVEELAQRLRIKSKLMQLPRNFLETFLELAIGNSMIYPVSREVCEAWSDTN